MMAMVPAGSLSPRREKHSPRAAAIDNHADIDVPLDFSFLRITDLDDIKGETPRNTVPKNKDGKFISKSLRLPHNTIVNLNGLPGELSRLLMDPEALNWLDISHNELTSIDPVLCDIPNLKVLYMHGNQIANIAEVDKLGGLALLHKLTLHGNPMENNTKNYKLYVMSKIPQLINFDFTTITKGDRITSGCVMSFTPTTRKKRKVEQD